MAVLVVWPSWWCGRFGGVAVLVVWPSWWCGRLSGVAVSVVWLEGRPQTSFGTFLGNLMSNKRLSTVENSGIRTIKHSNKVTLPLRHY